MLQLHNQARGVNGAVVFGQIGPAQDADDLRVKENAGGSWTIAGAWEPTDPAGASIVSFAAALAAAEPGAEVPLYFNIHTDDSPAGELRGQWVALGAVEHDGAGGASDGRLEVSLDADAARDLFEAFLRFLSRGTHSDRDPSRDGFGDQDFLAGLTGLVGLDGDKLDDLLGHGTHALDPFAAEHWV